tara:strand:+ start:792 stop:959 length:168 start_codon:yes stop_codon:yes gene_type:complete
MYNMNINDPRYDNLRKKLLEQREKEIMFARGSALWDEDRPVVGFIHPIYGAGIYE